MEDWKYVVTFDGVNQDYAVSSLGKVKSHKSGEWLDLKPSMNNAGYKYVMICGPVREKIYGIHVLVALAFIPGYEKGMEVNHKDLNKTNNTVENLEWVTKSQNQIHQYLARHPGYVKRKNYCKKCGIEISLDAEYCMKCSHDFLKKMNVGRDELKQDLLCRNILQISRKYGVSDSAIRKLCKKYNLEFRADVLRNTSDEGILSENWEDRKEEILKKKEEAEKRKARNKELSKPKRVNMLKPLTGEIIQTFESVAAANRYMGKNSPHISNVCHGRRGIAYGYSWEFTDDNQSR